MMTKKNSQSSKIIFLASVLLFTLAQTYLTAKPFFEREAPVEPDDAYAYILKAEQIRSGCFLQDCLALQMLREQIETETNNLEVAYHRAREHQRLFSVYHSTHSIALLGLHLVGLSYETGYSLIAIVGKVFLCLSLAYWLFSIYGKRAAAISLLILAPATFPGQGIHAIVPSNLALGLAFLAWGIILRQAKPNGSLLSGLLLFLLLTHPVGRLYTGVAIALAVLHWSQDRTKYPTLMLWCGLLLASFIGPLLITRPQIEIISGSFYPFPWDPWENFLKYLPNSLSLIYTWFSAFFNWVIGLGIVVLGILSLRNRRKLSWLYMFLVLLVLLVLGLVYTTPWYGAVVFERAWVPMAIFLTGLIGQLVLKTSEKTMHLFYEWHGNRQLQLSSLATRSSLRLVLVAAFLALGFYNYFPFYFRHYDLTLNNMIDRGNIPLNKAQPSELFSRSHNSVIFYTDEVNLYHFLTYGGFERGAIYLPAVLGAENESKWLTNDVDIAFLVLAKSKTTVQELSPESVGLPVSLTLKVLNSQGYAVLFEISK